MSLLPHPRQAAQLGLGIALAALLISCSPSTPQPGAAVDYYRTHAAQRAAMLKGCGNDPGGFGQAADCVNARAAERLEGVGSLRALPPMGLPAAAGEASPAGKH